MSYSPLVRAVIYRNRPARGLERFLARSYHRTWRRFRNRSQPEPMRSVRRDIALSSIDEGGFGQALQSIRVPVLFIVGDSDPVVPVELVAGTAERVPGAQFAVVVDGNHGTTPNRPEFRKRVAEFVKAVDTRGGGAKLPKRGD